MIASCRVFSPSDAEHTLVGSVVSRHEGTARRMISAMDKEALAQTGLDARGVVRLFGVLQSNGFASGIYLHPAMTNHSCRWRVEFRLTFSSDVSYG